MYTKPITEIQFWITNHSDSNVSLGDLGITIPARTNLNLLNRKSNITLEQCQKSSENGSIFAKSSVIKVRKVLPPENPVKPGVYQVPSILVHSRYKLWSRLKITEQQFEELNTSEEEFVSDLVEGNEEQNK